VLKTISPVTVLGYPNPIPSNMVPSSSNNFAPYPTYLLKSVGIFIP
jgi:hypothetical protein